MNTRLSNGYTLVEMAVVVVIIGLIIIGLIGSRSLVENARKNALIKDISQIDSSINAFQLRYEFLPGDFNNASAYWPNCDTPATDCNGDGDEKIENEASEDMRAWQHLALSEIYKGSFTGEGDGGAAIRTIGINIPKSNFSEEVGYNFEYWTNSIYSDTTDSQFIIAGARHVNGSTERNLGAFISGRDAKNIDNKMDEGDPDSGRLIALNGYIDGGSTQLSKSNERSCVDADIGDNTENVSYHKTTDNYGCILAIKLINPSAQGEF